MYLTYDEYRNYGGTLNESTFNSLIYKAQVKIDYYTYNRLKNDTIISERVKQCLVQVIYLINNYTEYNQVVTDVNQPILLGGSNDGVSISYGGYLGNTTPDDVNKITERLNSDIKQIIQEYLQGEVNEAGKVLLYRGVYK